MLQTVEQSKSWTYPLHPYPYDPEKCRELTKQFITHMDKTHTGDFMNDTILSFHKVFHLDKWINAEEEILKNSGSVFDDIKLPVGYSEVFSVKKKQPNNPVVTAHELKLIFYHPENKYHPLAILCTDTPFAFEAFEAMKDRARQRTIDEGKDPSIWDDGIWCLWDDIYSLLVN